ncbi:MAG TPA: periplasmic heavy metal sensor [Candidatus Krumholzibacteria bacterium]|nr:periplasmic heavy metal sensor [Candidatus Krumholzibacteria bacterium]
MKIRVLVGALVLLIVMNIAAIAAFLVVQARHPRGPVEWHMRERPLAGLDREKRMALIRSMREFHEDTRDLIEATRALEDSAIAAMGEDPMRRAHIDSLLQQISDNRLEIARRATSRMIEAGENLTPEERQHLMSALMRLRGHRMPASVPWHFEAPREEPEE